jgi:threonine synthase
VNSVISFNEPSTIEPVQRCIEPQCASLYDINLRLYECSRCSGLLEITPPSQSLHCADDWRELWRSRRDSDKALDNSGVWRFRELLPFTPHAPVVTLEEGNTPLYQAPRCAAYCGLDSLQLKHQGANPTGSFKDTGMTTAVTQALVVGARAVLCASTGNTSASLAAYAARADLQCAILVPHGQISHGKLAQTLDYGAQVLEVDGNFDDCLRLARALTAEESIYLVNSTNPFRIEGQKTVAAELLEQLNWRVPDHVIVPGGNLGNSTALGKGFTELFNLGLIGRLPKLSVIQAEGAAPFARLSEQNEISQFKSGSIPDCLLQPEKQPFTLASAIKIGAPVSWKKSLRAVALSGGTILSVSEQEIADAKAMIGREGIGCEPASAATVAGIKKLVGGRFIKQDEQVVAVLTGHSLKDSNYTINYHRQRLFMDDRSSISTEKAYSFVTTFSNSPIRVEGTKRAILDVLSA